MAHSIKCTHCGSVLKSANPVPAGKKVKCPKCAKVFVVAEEEEEEAPAEEDQADEVAGDEEEETPKPKKPAKALDEEEESEEDEDVIVTGVVEDIKNSPTGPAAPN